MQRARGLKEDSREQTFKIFLLRKGGRDFKSLVLMSAADLAEIIREQQVMVFADALLLKLVILARSLEKSFHKTKTVLRSSSVMVQQKLSL